MNRFVGTILVVVLAGLSLGTGKAQIYVTHPTAGTVGEYDSETGNVIKDPLISGLHSPHGIALADGCLYVTQYETGTIGKYDSNTGGVINANLVSGLLSPQAVTVSGNMLYVSSLDGTGVGGRVGKFDATTGTAINETFLTNINCPMGVVVSGDKLFVVSGDSMGSVAEYDSDTGTVVKQYLVPPFGSPCGIAQDGYTIWLTEGDDAPSGGVLKYEIGAQSWAGSFRNPLVKGLNYPSVLAVSGDSLYVNSSDGTIGKYDANSGKVANASFIPGQKGAVGGIAVAPAISSSRSSDSSGVLDPMAMAEQDGYLGFFLRLLGSNILGWVFVGLVGGLTVWVLMEALRKARPADDVAPVEEVQQEVKVISPTPIGKSFFKWVLIGGGVSILILAVIGYVAVQYIISFGIAGSLATHAAPMQQQALAQQQADALAEHVAQIRKEANSKPIPPLVPSTLEPRYGPLRPERDIDAMAARMKYDQDVYRSIRDKSLQIYAQRHPNKEGEKEANTVIRVMAYLTVWTDFYGEGLWQYGEGYAVAGEKLDLKEPLFTSFTQAESLRSNHSDQDNFAQEETRVGETFMASEYPAELKLEVGTFLITNLVKFKTEAHPGPDADSLKKIPDLIEKWGQNYKGVLSERLRHEQLFSIAEALLCAAQNDQDTLDRVIGEIDRDFNESDSTNPVKIALDGEYFVDSAWCARGSGFANTVTDQGWKLFSDRLTKASNILQDGYNRYPDEGEIPRSMIDVALGQSLDRDQMELWFQRAIKINPDDFQAYKCKEWYLQPRWYGSIDDILRFGDDCVKTDNWSAKVPMIMVLGVSEASQLDPTLYQKPEIWTAVEKVYLDYLTRYPQSTFFRTALAKHAYDSGRFDIAKEQLKILGNDWDRSTIGEGEYNEIAVKLGLR